MKEITELFDKMWNDYICLNPQAQKIVELLESKGEEVINDHIALRTFNHPDVCIDILAKTFIDHGYKYGGDYNFKEKKLYAKHFEHKNPDLPLVFISELKLEEFSDDFNIEINKLIAQVDNHKMNDPYFTTSGSPWSLTSNVYNKLKNESDYGAWLAAIGFRPNHFTVSINRLSHFTEVLELNSFLKQHGFKLNNSGGEVKGNKDVMLEQSSTLADKVIVEFTDKKQEIPSCYFEFAKRYPQKDGTMYRGFVAKSADKIFESTDKTQ